MDTNEARVKALANKIYRELYGEYGWGEMEAWNEAYHLAHRIVYKEDY